MKAPLRARFAPWATLLVPALFAVAWLLPCVPPAGFIADDFALVNLLEADGRSADWVEIGRQFGERWLYSQAYWRPIVNVVHGLTIDLFGFDAQAFVVVGIALHAFVVAATAWLALRLPGVGPLGAMLGAMLVAVHPAVVETVLWPSARVSGLEVAFRIAALCAFWSFLRRPGLGRRALVFALAALALASKESAVVLPVALLAVDLLDEPVRPWRQRVRIHAAFVPLWVSYFALRVAVLGSVVGSPVPDPDLADFATWSLRKLELLFAPAGALQAMPWALLVAVAACSRLRRSAWIRLVVLAIWLLASFAPTYKTPLGSGFVGSRMLYDALPVLALGAALLVARARVLATLLVVALIATSLAPTLRYAADFVAAWRTNAVARAELEQLGRSAAPTRPLAILSWPPCPAVPGPANPFTYFVLGSPAVAAEPFPALGLGVVLDAVPFSEALFRDPRPIHALLDLGSTVVHWSEEQQRLVRFVRDPASVRPGSVAGPLLRFERPRSPLDLTGIEVRGTAAMARATIVWHTSLGKFGGATGLQLVGGERSADGSERRLYGDATRHPALLALALAGGSLLGLEVEAEAEVLGIRLLSEPTELALPKRLAGAAIDFVDLDRTFIAPEVEAELPLRLVLAGPAASFAVDVGPGSTVRLPDGIREQIRKLGNALRAFDYLYWFETTPAQGSPGTARTAVDRFVLRGVPR